MHYIIKVAPYSGNSTVVRPNDPFNLHELSNFDPKLFEIKQWSYISSAKLTHYFEPLTPIRIGKYTSIAENVTFIGPSNHHWEWISSYPIEILNSFDRTKEIHNNQKNGIEIGSNVWIGTGVTIMPGVKIADGSVIGTNSTLTKSTKPFGIYAGNPATFIKFRFDTETVERLSKIKWWDFPDYFIKENLEIIFNNPSAVSLDYLETCSKFQFIENKTPDCEILAEILV